MKGTTMSKSIKSAATVNTGRDHLLDAFGVKSTDAIEALVKGLLGPIDLVVSTMEKDVRAMQAEIRALPATVKAEIKAEMIEAANAGHAAFVRALEGRNGVADAIVKEAIGKPVTAAVAASAQKKAGVVRDSVCDCEAVVAACQARIEALLKRLEAVEAELDMVDGKSKRLAVLDETAAASNKLAELLGFDLETGKSSVLGAYEANFKLVNEVLELDKDGKSAWRVRVDEVLKSITKTVDANASASAIAFHRANRSWLSPWLWALVALLATLLGYVIGNRVASWGWDNLPISLALAAIFGGIVAWIIGALVGGNSSGFTSVASAQASS